MEKYLYERDLAKKSKYNVWLAFPERESFSLSALGFLWLYKELDEDKDIFAERITTETQKTDLKLSEVDAIGFSFSYDMDFVNIFSILEKYGIPLKSEQRRKNGIKYPIIFAGGPVITTNPEPYKRFFDFMIIGDGEGGGKYGEGKSQGVNLSAIDVCRRNKAKSFDEYKMLLSEIDGVYVPDIHNFDNPVKKSYVKIPEPLYTPIISDKSFFPNTFIIEVSRGCYNCCGFCTASYLNLPVRFLPYETIIDTIEFGLKYTNKIALLGALVSAHPRFSDICKYIYKKVEAGQKIEMSVSSMRANTITPDIVKTLVATGQRNITIAVEAASERLRKVINKNISEEDIFNAIKISQENELKGIKIYCMIGLPTENEADIKDFIRLAKDLKQTVKNFHITFSFSTFVPKPHTPLQWAKREDTKSLEKKIQYLQKEFHKIGIEAKFSSPKWDYYQTVLSRGDAGLTEFLIEVYKSGGKLGGYKSAIKNLGIDIEKYVGEINAEDEKLPWETVCFNPDKTRLKEEYKRLMEFS